MLEPTQRKPPYKEKLLNLIGHIRVDAGHLGVVFRNGRFAYFLQPGWHPGLDRWSEELVAQIPVKMHTVDILVGPRSSDGFDFELKLSVWFKIDPSKAKRGQQNKMITIALSQNGNEQLKALVIREASYCLRKEAGNYRGVQLMAGHILSRLERRIRHHLQAMLMDLGILTQFSSSVSIEMASPPPALVQAQQQQYRRQQTVAMLRENPEATLQAHLLETLAQQDNVYYVNGRHTNDLMNRLIETAFDGTHNLNSSDTAIEWEQDMVKQTNGHGKRKKEVFG